LEGVDGLEASVVRVVEQSDVGLLGGEFGIGDEILVALEFEIGEVSVDDLGVDGVGASDRVVHSEGDHDFLLRGDFSQID